MVAVLLLSGCSGGVKIEADESTFLIGLRNNCDCEIYKVHHEFLLDWHTFADPATLRRELYDYGFLDRSRDGKVYRLAEKQPTTAGFRNLTVGGCL